MEAPRAAEQRRETIDRLSCSISRLFGGTTMSGDGRAVEVVVGGAGAAPSGAELLSNMVQAFDHQVQLTAVSMIIPALHVLRRRLCMSVADFAFFAEQSPLVPRERVDLFAKGLHAGYCLDFIQATHLLQPQFEYLVRTLLKAAGALTSTHVVGIHMEIGLSSLVDRPQMMDVFGPDVTFEMRAVMCHQRGANLRNAVAHGQADGALCESPQAIYAWWMMLRLILASLQPLVGSSSPPAAMSTVAGEE